MTIANTTIQVRKSGTTGVKPTSLANGELALNFADGKLYYVNTQGNLSFFYGANNGPSFSTANANNTLLLASTPNDTLSFNGSNGVTISACTTTKTITVGYQGAIGPQGYQGYQGVQGAQGFQGVQGSTGPQGLTGPQGVQGAVGQQGFQGVQGSTGPQGNQGVQGAASGVNPSNYIAQATLANNQTIPTGTDTVVSFGSADFDPQSWINTGNYRITPNVAGYYEVTSSVDMGSLNYVGQTNLQLRKNGNSITITQQPAANNAGPVTLQATRTIYLNGTTDYITATVWQGSGGNLTLPTGNGIWITVKLISYGINGSQGVQGAQGATGAQGAIGAQGSQGVQGSTGPQGTIGAQGAQGSQGYQGVQGATGPQGTIGAQGSQGYQGVQGAQGATGPQGTIGAQGAQGVQGAVGPNYQNAYDQANGAFSQANSAFNAANNASSFANGAFTKANSSVQLNATSQTITGNVNINGSLSVTGNVSITGNVTQISGNSGQFFGNTAGFGALYAGIATGYLLEPQIVTQITSNYNGYSGGINMQNINSGSNASSDLFISADNGTLYDGFSDFGLASSSYAYSGYNLIGPNDGYWIVTGNTITNGGNMIMSTGYNNDIIFAQGGTNTGNEVARFKYNTGLVFKSNGITFADGTKQNTAAAPYDYSNAAFAQANNISAYANAQIAIIQGVDNTQNTNITSAQSFANGAFAVANTKLSASGFTNNGVLYANGTGYAVNSSTLTFDGTNLGFGVPPSAWGIGTNGHVLEFSNAGSMWNYSNTTGINLSQNVYYNGAYYYKSTGAATLYAQGLGQHFWYNAPSGTAGTTFTPTQTMTLDVSGNLGLGVTPSAWGSNYKAIEVSNGGGNVFGIAGYGTTGIGFNFYNNGTNDIYKFSVSAAKFQVSSSGQHQWFTAPSGTAGNAITFTQAMTLDNSGRLLVGTTTAQGGAGTFVSSGNSLWASSTTAGNAALVLQNTSAGTSTFAVFQSGSGNGSTVGSIGYNGSLTLYNTTSDQRLKENIADAAPASTLIDSLQVRQYNWKSDGSHQRYGFIAQELVTVAPEAVHQPADPEEMMAVDYSKLVPMLVKEIQDLRKRLAALEAK